MNLLIDKPISKKEEDKLNRGEFVKSFSRMLLTSDSKDGMVLLLNGKWGSGKTSIVNLLKEQISFDTLNNKDIGYVPIIHDFSPWNVVSQDGIISQFFDTLSSGFLKNKIRKILKTIRNSKVFQETFKTLNYIPLLNTNPAWNAISNLKKKFDDYVDSFKENKDLLGRKNEIINTLEKSYTRHIVFIDDLDRLNDSEIKLVIQLIKSVCNFPNVIYILSADSKIIQSALKNEQSFNAEGDKYLEKIIQATFDIPDVKEDKILEIAYKDLDALFESKLNDTDVERFQTYRYLGLLDSIKTIRDEKRFINLLRVTFDAYQDELDIPDFIAISYLKFVNPQLIQLLIDYSEHLFGKYYDRYDSSKQIEDKFKNELLKINNDPKMYSFIKEMFPYMFTGSYDNRELYLSKRICSRNRFNLFLTLQLDSDDLSITRFNNAVQSKKYEDLIEFSKGLTSTQGRKFLLLLVNYVNSSKNIEDCEFIAQFLLKDLSTVQMQDKMFLVRKDFYVRDFIKDICKKYSSESAYALISKFIDNSSDVYSVSEIAIELNLKEANEKHQYGFSDDVIKNITNTACSLIMERIENGNLDIPIKARAIRLVYEQNKELLKKHFDALDNLGKINLLSDMIWIGSMTDKKRHLTYSFSIDWIKYLLPDDEFADLFNSSFNGLSNRNKQRMLVLKMQMSKFEPSDFHGEKCYLAEDIQRYCNDNNIAFSASDSVEEDKNE